MIRRASKTVSVYEKLILIPFKDNLLTVERVLLFYSTLLARECKWRFTVNVRYLSPESGRLSLAYCLIENNPFLFPVEGSYRAPIGALNVVINCALNPSYQGLQVYLQHIRIGQNSAHDRRPHEVLGILLCCSSRHCRDRTILMGGQNPLYIV